MRRFVARCAVTSVTVFVVIGSCTAFGGSSAGALDSRCDELQAIVPATIGAVMGDLSGAARHARQLRDLSTRELIPARLKPALRKLARFFERAPDLGLAERADALQEISRPLTKVVVYATQVCASTATTSTTLELR